MEGRPALPLVAWFFQTPSIRKVRAAICQGHASFPSQVPVFRNLNRPDIQWRLVLLYFIRGWTVSAIASRYNMTRTYTQQLIRKWLVRAILLAFVEEISPPI